MGLFDKLLGRGNSANNDSKDISVLHEEKALADMSDIEKAIAERGNFDLSKLKKIPLTNVAAIGGVFAQAVPMIQTAVNGGNLANGSIARIVFPDGVTGEPCDTAHHRRIYRRHYEKRRRFCTSKTNACWHGSSYHHGHGNGRDDRRDQPKTR